MLINSDRNPKYSIFYIAYEILTFMNKNKKIASIEELFQLIRDTIDDNIGIDYLYYTLDWMYLMSMITLKGEKVILC